MDLRQLRSFLAVIDHGSFSAAADALFTVQSNVSAHVARLETELGAKLLDRRTRILTPAGNAVERRARDVIRQLDAIRDDLASLEDRIIGNVACGATPSIGLRVIPPMLAQATRELPEVSVTVVEAHSGVLEQQLLAGDIDLAITTGSGNPELTSTPLFDEDIVAVMAPDHPLATADLVTRRDLAGEHLLLPLQDNPLYHHIMRSFEEVSITPTVGLEVGSSALVSAMAEAGVGIALIPATAAADAQSRTAAVRPIEGMAPRRLALTAANATQPSRAVDALRGILKSAAVAAASSMPGCHPPLGLETPPGDVARTAAEQDREEVPS